MRTCLPAVLVLCLVAPAAAETPAAVPLPDQLKAAEKAKDPAAWVKLIQQVPDAYGPATNKERKALMKRLGAAVKSDEKDVGPTALKVMVKIGDGELAWSEALRHVLPDRKQEEITPFDMQVFGTMHALRPDGAIDTLLTLVRKAKSPDVARLSMRTLGGYERSKKRVHVLTELGKTLIANAPSGRRKGGAGGTRWKALWPFAAQSLNNLTGQTADLKTWGVLWMKNRKEPEVLFVRPLVN